MGRTPRPLKIVLLPPCDGWEEFTKLAAQGHEVVTHPDYEDFRTADKVLGGNCHLMDDLHREYLNLALADGRRRKYGKGLEETG